MTEATIESKEDGGLLITCGIWTLDTRWLIILDHDSRRYLVKRDLEDLFTVLSAWHDETIKENER